MNERQIMSTVSRILRRDSRWSKG